MPHLLSTLTNWTLRLVINVSCISAPSLLSYLAQHSSYAYQSKLITVSSLPFSKTNLLSRHHLTVLATA